MTTDDEPRFHGALLSGDLLFGSQAAGTFARLGGRLHEVADAAGLIAVCREHPISLALVDLTSHGVAAADLVAQVRAALDAPPPLLAYGPHVQAGLLAAARSAGFDQVLTRGQIHAQLGEILGEFVASVE